MDDIIVAKDLVKVYRIGSNLVYGLRGINMAIKRGDFIAIMGPSGSGKTTLLNMIGLLDRPSSGKILVDGIDVTKLGSREIARIRNRKIGFVFQFFNLVNRLTVLENIELPLIARGVSRAKRVELAREALLKVGGELSWMYKKPHQLSGGQQQRVAIARAIVGDPEIVLADEPTGNLDRASAKVVIKTFTELNREGKAIAVVTHDPEVANCTNKIYIIRDGIFVDVRDPQREKCLLYVV